MKNKENIFMSGYGMRLSLAVLALIAGGCATQGPKSGVNDKAAIARSQAFLHDDLAAAPESKERSSEPCALPTAKDSAHEKDQATLTPGPSKNWRAWVARANTCVREKNWKTLEDLANLIAKADLDSPWGVYFLGVAAENKGQNARAIWMVDLALKKTGGQSALLLYQRGRIWLKQKETLKALEDVHKAVALDTRLTDGHLWLAELYHRDQEFDKAVTHFREALKNDAKSFRALTGLAEVRLLQAQNSSGAADEAIDLYSRTVSAHPHQLQGWVRLAYIHESIKKNSQLALSTYKNLKSTLDSGSIKEKPNFDLSSKIKSLEEIVQKLESPTRLPAKT